MVSLIKFLYYEKIAKDLKNNTIHKYDLK